MTEREIEIVRGSVSKVKRASGAINAMSAALIWATASNPTSAIRARWSPKRTATVRLFTKASFGRSRKLLIARIEQARAPIGIEIARLFRFKVFDCAK